MRKLAEAGITKAEIARRLGIGEASVYRVLAPQADRSGTKAGIRYRLR